MPLNFDPFNHFHRWVEKNQINGTDGRGNDAKYIPFGALKEYWEDHRISPILNAGSHATPIHVSIDDILARFLRIFSILAYISTTDSPKLFYIKRFVEEAIDDNLLPFKARPDALSSADDGLETFHHFQKRQWLFSPVTLGPNRLQSRELLLDSVLPITVEKLLSGRDGESATVKKCKVDPSCGLPIDSIVLKEFDSSEIEYSFKNEVDSYINLENNVPSHIYGQQFLKYYGSFKKGDKAFIMLEYADQGSLLDFFERNQLPLERQELRDLWMSLIKLFIGLEYIHGLEQDPRNTNFGNVRCVHHDLKPANIFVFKQGSETDYSYRFKIGDFGMSSMALVKTKNKSIRAPADPSTKMYGAPELSSRYAALEGIDYGALWEMDIWSFGCVLFECLVWMACGSRGRLAFFRMRQKETDADLRHRDQGYSGCFHNGHTRVQAVDDMLTLVMERRRVFDDLSRPIGDLILREMLIATDKHRLDARTLLPRFEEILEAKTPPPGHLITSNSRSLISPTREGRPSQEDRDDGIPHVNHQAVTPTCKALHGYEEPKASNSPMGSRRGRRRPNGSRSSHEADETRESLLSPASPESLDREQSHPPSVPHEPRVISPSSPLTAGRGASSAVNDPDNKPDRSSKYNLSSPPAGELIANESRTNGRDSLYGSANVASKRSDEVYAVVKIPKVLQWIDRKKKNWAPEALPDHERAMSEIKDREQIFVIDDSSSMRTQHWDKVVETVNALGYLVKSADPDGVELFLTSRPEKPKQGAQKEIGSLVRYLQDQRGKPPHNVKCNMENSLSPILQHVKRGLKDRKIPKFLHRPRRGTNVYILTDAIWEGGSEVQCGVEEPIKDLVRTMQAQGKTRTTVALQFIQFGDDSLGEERLQYLDDTLGKELGFDIVDRRHHQRDGVWHMLLGSISRGIDNENNVEAQTGMKLPT